MKAPVKPKAPAFPKRVNSKVVYHDMRVSDDTTLDEIIKYFHKLVPDSIDYNKIKFDDNDGYGASFIYRDEVKIIQSDEEWEKTMVEYRAKNIEYESKLRLYESAKRAYVQYQAVKEREQELKIYQELKAKYGK